jgi:hypothetical protein
MGELAKRVRGKYPSAYADMSDQQLEAAVLAKYPEYKDLAGTPAPQAQPEFRPGFAEGVSGAAGMPSAARTQKADCIGRWASDLRECKGARLLLADEAAGVALRMASRQRHRSLTIRTGKTVEEDAADELQRQATGRPTRQPPESMRLWA